MYIRNRHKVPKKQWSRWSESAHRVFNFVYEAMRRQCDFKHPQARMLLQEEWKTTRWNAAWIAADAIDHMRGTKPRCLVKDLIPKGILSRWDISDLRKALAHAWARGYAARMDQEGK